MISLEKWNILTPLQKFPKHAGNLGKMIVATSFEKLPKVCNKSPNLVPLIKMNFSIFKLTQLSTKQQQQDEAENGSKYQMVCLSLNFSELVGADLNQVDWLEGRMILEVWSKVKSPYFITLV